ncbi:MAG: HTH-type transcriptional regulator YesS [Firmicutes bacterium ADurb.Bin193]|nr:MAG: HTH-type transcriptional regulator YesS [Firmicutes bacterium ADurb.Bin193]
MGIKKLWSKRKTVFASWIFSYIIFMLIYNSFAGMSLFVAHSIISNMAEESGYNAAGRVGVVVDSYLKNAQRLVSDIASDGRVSFMLASSGQMSGTIGDTATQLSDRLKNDISKNEAISDIYIYFKPLDLVLSPDSHAQSEPMYSALKMGDYLSYRQWISLLTGEHSKTYLNIRKTTDTDESAKEGLLLYIQSLAAPDGNEVLGAIVARLDSERLSDITAKQGSNVTILDKFKNILVSTLPAALPERTAHKVLEGNYRVTSTTLLGKSVLISYIPSEVAELSYLVITPKSAFGVESGSLQGLLWIGALLLLAVGVFLSVFFAKRNYKPVKEIMEEVFEGKGHNEKGANEYELITKAVHEMVDEKKKIRNVLGHQNEALKSSFISRLLKGRAGNYSSVNDMLAALDIKFQSDSFAVVLLHIDDCGDIFHRARDGKNQKELAMVNLVITHAVEEMLELNDMVGIMVESESMMTCLVNLGTKSTNSLEDIIRTVNEALKFVYKNFNIKLTASVSDIHKTFSGIPKAYSEAFEAMEYRLIKGNGIVIPYNTIVTAEQNYYYPIETEQALIMNIKSGDCENAELVLEDIFERNFSKKPSSASLSISLARCLMFDIMSTVIKTLDEIGSHRENILVEQMDSVESFLKCSTIIDMKETIKKIIRQMCHYMLEEKGIRPDSIGLRVKKFIDENYENADLNISTIAEMFSMHPDYISRVFKTQIGEGLLDYLNRVRLVKAKYLLKHEKYNIGEIAQIVGYYNSNTFIRTFKKYEGVTPGSYRNA